MRTSSQNFKTKGVGKEKQTVRKGSRRPDGKNN